MAICLFANNATSTLAGSINNVATSCNLAPGTGALFPDPDTGEYFVLTFTDSATGLVNEIVHVTARATDTLTIVRAQEGTAAAAWNAGDLASSLITAGQLEIMAQQQQADLIGGLFLVDNSGAANSIEITLPAYVTNLDQLNGTPLRIRMANTNSGTTTIDPVGFSSYALYSPNLSEMRASQLVQDGVITVVFDADSGAFFLQSITTAPTPNRGRTVVLSGAATVTVPSTAESWTVTLTGGGGGGGGGDGTFAGSGGGAGGTCILVMNATTATTRTITYSIGAGGTGGVSSGGGETNGGTSTATCGGYSMTAVGGTAGEHDASPAGGGGGGGTAAGGMVINGGAGTDGAASGGNYGGNGGASYWGGGGRASTLTSSVQNGAAYGSGAGGGYGGASVTGGAGAGGVMVVEWGA